MGNLMLFGALVALAVMTRNKGWSEGEGPFDLKPADSDSDPFEVNKVYAASGRQYEVSSFRRGVEQTYHVAVRVGGRDWIAFLQDDSTGSRVLFRAHGADAAVLDALRKDFAL